MRQRLIIIVTLIVVVVVLVLINAASYVRVEATPDTESAPDRSTYNAGPTGTRALYDFLHESGYEVTRWRDTTSSLLSSTGPKPATVVVVGETKFPFTKVESNEILLWVQSGGRLVIIDRSPPQTLLPQSGEWVVREVMTNFPWNDLDPANFEAMTREVKPVPPSQAATIATNVENILPSRFASAFTFARMPPKTKKTSSEHVDDDDALDSEPETVSPTKNAEAVSPAPIAIFRNDHGALLAEYPHGKGSIVLLSDPYIVANNGISRADNLQLAINIVTGAGGVIAFDEFHQGRGSSNNALIKYFAGTPVLAICAQLMLIALALVWSRGTRFARPLPLPQVDRRSGLEFVASMAELQQRAKAHDLALENIYGRVRRVLVRYAGLNQSSPRAEIAQRVALRSKINEKQLESLMRSCEDTINGAPTSAKETLRLVRRLRQVEERLGLQGRARDAKQRDVRT
ncbi:MAG TPA: DUF4350 domain-containing protein [Pyrinomonadaceae bacterium]|jgi:hypothetical protein|nr:DUF4350 domain-containing protein [Pyrinomonadaceae bacterium]